MTSTTHDSVPVGPAPEAVPGLAHVMPPQILLATFAALVVLTVVTVIASTLGLGPWEIWTTLGIATIKIALSEDRTLAPMTTVEELEMLRRSRAAPVT